jgi:hypothetical protein
MLADREHLARGVDVVWFASDYPYPISLPSSEPRPATGDVERPLWPLASSGLGNSTRLPDPGSSLPSKPLPKSGTFRNFNEQHDAAVSILQDAFKQGGELETWTLTDVSEAIAHRLDNHNKGGPSAGLGDVVSSNDRLEDVEGLVRDPGVLGIVDKLIATEATLFVSGSRKCSRHR